MILSEKEAIQLEIRQKATNAFFEYADMMRKTHPQPFEEDTRHWKEREKTMTDLFTRKVKVEAWERKRGGYSWEYHIAYGHIEDVTEGVWGYEGDAIAVKINGKYYPSSQVREPV